MDPYVIYGSELSYFTRKLEAACLFYDIAFELQSKQRADSALIESRAGTHQVPVLRTPENWMIADTTPLLQLLDGRYPMRRMFPEGPLGVLVHAVEEYFDEWIARTMVHYRWHYPDSAEFASMKMAQGDAAVAERVRQWGPRACRATGTDSVVQQQAAEAEYLRILEAMESQLSNTRYLLGSRPTAVDCVVLGGLRAHTLMDPDPKKVTAQFGNVVEYAQGARDAWDGSGTLAPFPESTAFARFILNEMTTTYQLYVLANQAAQAAGAKACQADVYGETVSFLSRPYPEYSRQLLISRILQQLDAAEQQQVRTWLRDRDLRCFVPT